MVCYAVPMARLYVVGTPIGNLEDITFRAIRILGEADTILCEDTRVTRKLLDRYEIRTATMSYHAHSNETKVERIIELLESGKTLALVSDAGTPGVSDPGSHLIAGLRDYFAAKNEPIEILAVPGASALTAALSVAGLPVSDFLFLGFLPHKKGRETLFKEIAASERTVVFYESTHRILKAVESLRGVLEPTRKIVIARELTKIYEEVIAGTPAYVLEFLAGHPEKKRGEFVVLVAGRS